MVDKSKTGWLYLLLLWALISALTWPAYVLCSTLVAVHQGEGWQLDAWHRLPHDVFVEHFMHGYRQSIIVSIPMGLIAVVDYLLLSRYKATWLIGGILFPISALGIAFAAYREPGAALPALLATALLLAVIHRLVDILAGRESRGRLR